MSDELTPREKELFSKLPRERLPAGLEERVVGAMRDEGFIGRRRRTIAITTRRVASLVAACAALVIGAYSIGLHRGGGDPVLTVPPRLDSRPASPSAGKTGTTPGVAVESEEPTRTVEKSDADRVQSPSGTPSGDAPARKRQSAFREEATGAAEPVVKSDVGAEVDDGGADDRGAGRSAEQAPPVLQEQTPAPMGGERANDAPEPSFSALSMPIVDEERAEESVALPTVSADAVRRSGTGKAIAGPLPLPQPIRDDLSDGRLTFLLNGISVTVAADSARVVGEPRGRILIVYTPDGIMRLLLTD